MNFNQKELDKMANKALAHGKKVSSKLPLPNQLPLIEHSYNGEIIPQRPVDGYINATAMCKKAGKLFNDYHRQKTTKDFLSALSLNTGIPVKSTATGIPVAGLIQTVMGGNEKYKQGTWVHPKVAIHLAQWLSSDFAVQVTEWVFEWMSGNISGKMPSHLRRYVANMHKIPNGYFSMLNESVYSLIAPLEQEGYSMPAKLMPDISYGRMFSDFLRSRGINPQHFPEYTHEFTDGKRPPVQARLYPNKYLGEFRDYLSNVWIPKKSASYFQRVDKKALPYLEQIIDKALPSPRK